MVGICIDFKMILKLNSDLKNLKNICMCMYVIETILPIFEYGYCQYIVGETAKKVPPLVTRPHLEGGG